MSDGAPEGAIEIRSDVLLPARREEIAFATADGLTLVGEFATPLDRPAVASLVAFHPLPTHGGFMDSHVYRKAAARLPALADLAVLRFNFRGVSSPRGASEGAWGHGIDERLDVEAAVAFAQARALPSPWLVGWSFGTEMILEYARDLPKAGVILLSPPLKRTSDAELARWADVDVPVVALVPEHDDYLRPPEALARFGALAPNVEVVAVAGAKHLWVGEAYVRRVLTEIVARVNPAALPLPTEWPAG